MATNNNTTIQKLVNLANNYDRFTAYIDNYRQQQQAEKANERIQTEFIETAKLLGIDASSTDFYKITNSTGTTYSKLTVEEAVDKFLQEKGLREDTTMETNEVANVTVNEMCETCANYNPNEDSLACQACGEDGISCWEPKEESETTTEMISVEDNKEEKNMKTLKDNEIRDKAIALYKEKFGDNQRHANSYCDYWYRIGSVNFDFYVDIDFDVYGTKEYKVNINHKNGFGLCIDEGLATVYDFSNCVEYTLDENNNVIPLKENKEEIKMEKKTLSQMILNMNRNERLVYVRDNILNITDTSNELYITKNELAKFLFDNDIIQRQLSKKEIKKTNRQELVDILDTAVQNLMKAGRININKEETEMETTVQSTVKETKKEEVVMAKTTLEMLEIIKNPETSDEEVYKLFNEMIKEETGMTMREFIITIADEFIKEETTQEYTTVSAEIQEPQVEVAEEKTGYVPVEYTDTMSADILKKVIIIADGNSNHNIISDWMLTSAVAEVVVGHPLKGKDENGKWTEFYKSFTPEQKENIKTIRVEFLRRGGFKPIKDKNNKTTSYIIPTKSLVYGRHLWLGKACVYHYISKNSTKPVVYHVSLNGIKNTTTNAITQLDDAAYTKLEATCKFIM